MRLVELLTILGSLVGVFLSAIATLENNLIKKIRNISAHSEKKSKDLSNNSLVKWRFNQLQKFNVVLKGEDEEYYVDESNYKKLKKNRVIAVVIFLIVSISLIVIIHKYVL